MMRHSLWPWTIEIEKAKDSKRHPFTRHIVAVRDLHGDLPNAKRVLDFSMNLATGVDSSFLTGVLSISKIFTLLIFKKIKMDDTIFLFDLMTSLTSTTRWRHGSLTPRKP